jgi:hypothetical protein
MGTSPQLSGSPPNLPALSRRRNGKLYLFVPAEEVLAHKTFTAIGASVAPLVPIHDFRLSSVILFPFTLNVPRFERPFSPGPIFFCSLLS